jgi:hypothetical protein
MSHMNRKSRSHPSVATTAQRARDATTQVVPMAKNAVPMAKNVGLTAKQSAEDAVARVAPRVKDARAWAAPHVEQAGLAVRDKIAPAISEKIAPAISDALIEAAHRLDNPAPRRRRWPRVVAGIAMLAAAGSAVVAAALRRWATSTDLGTGGSDSAPGDSAPGAPEHGATDDKATGDSARPTSSSPAASGQAEDKEAKPNGRVHTS